MSELSPLSQQEWDIRHFIYTFFVENERPPTPDDAAKAFSLTVEDARFAFQRLNDHHHIFLEPNGIEIRMANPLSAVPIHYRVQVGENRLWANCAWDSLGIGAMLGADVDVEAVEPLSGEIMRYGIRNGILDAPDLVVHFLLGTGRWYDDLIHT